MFDIIKTLLVSLCFAATGAGIAWSITSDARAPFASAVVESGSNRAAKSDRLDAGSPKADRLVTTAVAGAPGQALVVYAEGQAASTVFRAPLVMASAH